MTDKNPEESGIDLSLLEHIYPLRQVPAKQAANSTLAVLVNRFLIAWVGGVGVD